MDRNWNGCQYFSKQNLFTVARQSSAKNARMGAFFNPHQIENRGEKAKFLHTCHDFVHVFSHYLVPFCGFVSTPKNKKSTPNFFLALTFWSQRCPFFAKYSPIGWMTIIWQTLSKLENFRPKVFSRRIFELWRGKMSILSISFHLTVLAELFRYLTFLFRQ